MLNDLPSQAEDKILALMAQFRSDPRDDKIDLGVGVYRNAHGHTPIMRAVKSAETILLETQETKSYVALAGDPAFTRAMADLVLGDAVPQDRIAAAATPGGTGAVRLAFDLVRMANPDARVFVPGPTWPNHLSILDYLGMPTVTYRYFDTTTCEVDVAGLLEDLGDLRAGDAVLLHGCCHNPTGANLALTDWQAVIDIITTKGALPLIDIAYQGFGDGLDDDAAATRLVASSCPETLIAASCSKNFGIYRERTGLLMAVSNDASSCDLAQGNLAYLNRQTYSFPPDHGARLVTMILEDETLRADWQAELADMRAGMLSLRQQLASELRTLSNSDRFDFLAGHRGMFSRLGASPEQVARMREDHGIYMVGDSRINIAGLNTDTVPVLARAMIDAGV